MEYLSLLRIHCCQFSPSAEGYTLLGLLLLMSVPIESLGFFGFFFYFYFYYFFGSFVWGGKKVLSTKVLHNLYQKKRGGREVGLILVARVNIRYVLGVGREGGRSFQTGETSENSFASVLCTRI